MKSFKGLLEGKQIALLPGVHDALSARIAERSGFDGLCVGGYDTGATTTITEPLLTQNEMLDAARAIRRGSRLPMLLDVGAGFGEPMHVARLMAEAREAHVDAVQLEDQIFPKRAHYFKDYKEHTIPLQEFIDKIYWAKKATGDDVVIIARTDTFKTEGIEEAVRRAHASLEAGAHGILAFPNTRDEAIEFPKRVRGPVIYVNTHGNRVGRPMLTKAEAQEMGYRMLVDTHIFLFAAFDAMMAIARTHSDDKVFTVPDSIASRRSVEEILEIQKLIDIEGATVETDK